MFHGVLVRKPHRSMLVVCAGLGHKAKGTGVLTLDTSVMTSSYGVTVTSEGVSDCTPRPLGDGCEGHKSQEGECWRLSLATYFSHF